MNTTQLVWEDVDFFLLQFDLPINRGCKNNLLNNITLEIINVAEGSKDIECTLLVSVFTERT